LLNAGHELFQKYEDFVACSFSIDVNVDVTDIQLLTASSYGGKLAVISSSEM